MPGIRVGYVRVSTDEQHLAIQKNAIKADKFFEDVWSGKDTDRPGFKSMMDFIREGDTLVVHRLDRLSRRLSDLLSVVHVLLSKNINVEFIEDRLYLGPNPTAMQMMFLSILGTFAEFERNVTDERRKMGIAHARAKGVKCGGRKPRFTVEILKEIEQMKKDGATIVRISKYTGISRTSVYNYLKLKGPATREAMGLK